MKKLIIFIFVFSFAFSSDKGSNYVLKDTKAYYQSEMANIKITIEHLVDIYQFVLEVESDGWVAIGFDSGFAMKDGEFLIINNKEGEVFLEHHYGTSAFSHKDIRNLDKNYNNEYIELVYSELKDNYGKYVFNRKLDVKGKYFKDLQKGVEVELLIAYRKDNNLKKKHDGAEHFNIILP